MWAGSRREWEAGSEAELGAVGWVGTRAESGAGPGWAESGLRPIETERDRP